MELAKVEQYVSCLLESWAVYDSGEERVVWQTLHDLLMAVSRFELMTDDEKALTTALAKKMQIHFETKFSIKERKETKKKKNFPPNPLLKEKAKKETEENTPPSVGDADLEAFRKECEGYVGKYGPQLMNKFYNYFTQRDANGKMRFQKEQYWDMSKRLESWSSNLYTANDTAAAERLKKQKKRQAVAQERAEANDRLWQQYADMKKGAVSHEEWRAMKVGLPGAVLFGVL